MSITLPSIGIQGLAPITPQNDAGRAEPASGFAQIVEQVSRYAEAGRPDGGRLCAGNRQSDRREARFRQQL